MARDVSKFTKDKHIKEKICFIPTKKFSAERVQILTGKHLYTENNEVINGFDRKRTLMCKTTIQGFCKKRGYGNLLL